MAKALFIRINLMIGMAFSWINDSTEGFRLVEQEGDMRLYEIIE